MVLVFLLISRSKSFNDFLKLTLTKDPNQRPSAQDLLSHPFLSPQADSQEIIKSLIKRSLESRMHRLMSLEEVTDAFDFDGVDSEKKPELSADVNLQDKERKDSIHETLPSQSNKQQTSLSFTAQKICRLGFQVNCSDFWSIFYCFYY